MSNSCQSYKYYIMTSTTIKGSEEYGCLKLWIREVQPLRLSACQKHIAPTSMVKLLSTNHGKREIFRSFLLKTKVLLLTFYNIFIDKSTPILLEYTCLLKFIKWCVSLEGKGHLCIKFGSYDKSYTLTKINNL